MADSHRKKIIQDAVEELETPLICYASRIVRDLERARDVVQETFLRLCRADLGSIERRLRPWLFTVCRNLAIDVRRKESPMTASPGDMMDTNPASGPSPDEAAEAAEEKSRIEELLDGLPPDQAEAITLKFHHQMRYRQIAEVMDTSVSNVGFLIHTGINSIRQAVTSSGSADNGGSV